VAVTGLVIAAGASAEAEAQLKAGSETEAAGAVTATLRWAGGQYGVDDAHLRIDRAGAVQFDGAIADLCDQCRFVRAGEAGGAGERAPGDASPDLDVVDLDGDGEPEVLVTANTGGAHCCTRLGVWDYRAQTSGYGHIVEDFGNVGYSLKDLDGDGHPELATADDAFAYAFTAYAVSGFPTKVVRWSRAPRPGFVDVTRSFPAVIRKDAAEWLRLTRKVRRRDDARGVLAAYVADMYLLGKAKTARAEIARQVRRGVVGSRSDRTWPGGSRYKPALLRFLHARGYR
jgi:hypothetical protein